MEKVLNDLQLETNVLWAESQIKFSGSQPIICLTIYTKYYGSWEARVKYANALLVPKRLRTRETQDGITEHGEFISNCGSGN